MSDLSTALHRIHQHGVEVLSGAAEMLRQLVRDTCDAISAAEGSILVPSEDKTELRFLVSINPALDPSDITVPVDQSVSGYVFSSRQAMAKVKPDSPGVSKVDKAANIETKYLLAVPIVDDDRVYGVATFVNRKGEHLESPFSVEDLKTAQAFGEIYATAMKLYRKIEFSTGMSHLEVCDHACEFGLDGFERIQETSSKIQKYRLPALLAEKSMTLPEREREMLVRFADLLDEYAIVDEDEEEYDL